MHLWSLPIEAKCWRGVFQGITTTMWWEIMTRRKESPPLRNLRRKSSDWPDVRVWRQSQLQTQDGIPALLGNPDSKTSELPWIYSQMVHCGQGSRPPLNRYNSKSMSPLQISFLKTIGNINQCCQNWKLGKRIGEDKRTLSISCNVSIAKSCPPAGLQSPGPGKGGGVWAKQTGSFLCL